MTIPAELHVALAELLPDAEMRILRTLAAIAEMREYRLEEGEHDRLDEIKAILRGEAS